MASPITSLYTDPAFAAFVRSSGLATQLAAADAAQQRRAIQSALGLQTEDLESRGQKQRRGIRGQQESRGVFRSGQTLQRQAEQEEAQARERSGLELMAATRAGKVESDLLSRIANQQMKGAELGLDTAGQLAYDEGAFNIKNRI